VPARSRLPACHSPNSFPKLSLLMLPSLTVAKEVLPSLGRLFAPPALTIILQPKLLEVRSCRCMPAFHLIIPDCQRLLAAHQDWPLTSILRGSLSNPVPVVLLHRSFSHYVFATALCSEILRTLFAAEMNARSQTASTTSTDYIACRSVSSFPGMPECPGIRIHQISVSIPWSCRRAQASLLIHLANCCPGHISSVDTCTLRWAW